MLIGDDLPSLYAYNRWANERVAESCAGLTVEEYARSLGGGWPCVRDTLVHIGSATQAWRDRFAGNSPSRLLTGADVPELAGAARLLGDADRAMEQFVAETPEDARRRVLAYVNLSGATKRVPYWAVLRHVVNHASYHRGQISTMIRTLGHDPKATDLAFWAILQTPQA
jgi:uncharacterized damage-inducible protein DinB